MCTWCEGVGMWAGVRCGGRDGWALGGRLSENRRLGEKMMNGASVVPAGLGRGWAEVLQEGLGLQRVGLAGAGERGGGMRRVCVCAVDEEVNSKQRSEPHWPATTCCLGKGWKLRKSGKMWEWKSLSDVSNKFCGGITCVMLPRRRDPLCFMQVARDICPDTFTG